MDKIYAKYYSTITPDEFSAVITMDPTTKLNHMGEYSKWLLKLYMSDKFDCTDGILIRMVLSKYHKAKIGKKLPKEYADINKFKTIEELSDFVSDIRDNSLETQSEQKAHAKKGTEVVHESDKWLVIIPHTSEASIQYGKGTKWCTAGLKYNRFNTYNDIGFLYIIINKKNPSEKYQIHFETQSFMDDKDKKVNKDDFRKNVDSDNELFNFFKELRGEINTIKLFTYDYVGDYHYDLARVEKNGKWNFIDRSLNVAFDKWFDFCGNFIEGFADIQDEQGYNFIKLDSSILAPDLWFDYVAVFHNGKALVRKKERWNYIDTNGKILSPDRWFDNCYNFTGGLAAVQLSGQWNYINENAEFLSPNQWFDQCYDFDNGLCVVELNNKYNCIDTDGRLISSEWVDSYDEIKAKANLTNSRPKNLKTIGIGTVNVWETNVYEGGEILTQ